MLRCNKLVSRARNGATRGLCSSKLGHGGSCGNQTCPRCGDKITKFNIRPGLAEKSCYWCRKCEREYQNASKARLRRRAGAELLNVQKAGKRHRFPCGCVGALPVRGASNQFSVWCGKGWACRCSVIIKSSKRDARLKGHLPIGQETSHAKIRKMMSNCCVFCGAELNWKNLGWGKTPNLDHNHRTGRANGFTCGSVCNPQGLKAVIRRLMSEISKLKREK